MTLMKLLERASFPGKSPGAGAPTGQGAGPRGFPSTQSGRLSQRGYHLQWAE